jgi:hypothetical protein
MKTVSFRSLTTPWAARLGAAFDTSGVPRVSTPGALASGAWCAAGLIVDAGVFHAPEKIAACALNPLFRDDRLSRDPRGKPRKRSWYVTLDRLRP